jgi:hypothetical protein
MSMRHLGPAIVAASVAVLIAAAGGAASVSLRPQPGTPDPKLMVLRAPDLHAHVKRQRYFRDTDFPSTISYERAFREGRTGSTKLLFVDSLAEVGANSALASRYVAIIRQLLGSKPEDFTFTKRFLRDIGETDVVNSTLHVGRVRSLRAGESSLDIPMNAQIRGRRTDLHVALFHVERLIAVLAIVGAPGSHVSLAAVTRLARLVAARMAAELAPKNVALPVVSGSPQVGETLTSSSGLWNGNPTRLSYRWQRCNASGAGCAAIAGATAQTYTLMQADAGSRIRVSVTARNGYGSTSVESAATAAVGTVAAPTNTTPPAITGTAQAGQTLTASTGSWSGTATSFSFQWQRCDAAGNACVAIPAATAGTYVVAASDSGFTLRVAVTATNAAGSATATSGQTAVVP